MLIDSYAQEDVFARVPQVAAQTDPCSKPWISCSRMMRSSLSSGPTWRKAIPIPCRQGGTPLRPAGG